MYFLIDGYNLLFNTLDDRKSFEKERANLIHLIQTAFKQLSLRGMVVFDGAHPGECELFHDCPIEIAYTPKGQSADEFILQQLALFQNRRSVHTVTNDGGLRRRARIMGSNTMTNSGFIHWLQKKSHVSASKPRSVSKWDVERLTKIFESRRDLPEDHSSWE